ncbi:MAG: hypothetical protein RIK87_26605 [Fuerstiella sp.]
MVTARTFLLRLRRIIASGALSLWTAQVVLGGCCDLPRAYRSPACDPAWGYHQTCWRQFPPLEPCSGWGDYCPACQPDGVCPETWQQNSAVGQVLPPIQNHAVPGNPLPPSGAPMPAYPPGQPFIVPGPPQYGSVPGGMTIPPQHYGQPPGAPMPTPGAPHGFPQNVPPNQTPVNPRPVNPTPVHPRPVDPGPSGQTPRNPMPANPAPFNPVAPQPMDEGRLPQPMPLPDQSGYRPQNNMRPASFQGNQLPVHPASAVQATGAPVPQGYAPTAVPWTGVEVPTAKPSLSDKISNGALKFRSIFRSSSDDVTFCPPVQPQPVQPEPKPSLWSRLTSW